jgi:citrate synthase
MSNDEIRRGLEDVVVTETQLSAIEGETGYLLQHDRLPTSGELERFSNELVTRRAVSEGTIDTLRAAVAEDVLAMDALRMGAATASLGGDGDTEGEDVKEESRETESLTLVARLPTIVAAYWRLQEGNEPLEPRTDLSQAANYLYMIHGEEPDDAQVRGLETYLNTVVDHGLNASTFTARTIVSTESDVTSAITGAIGALKGPLHGGAPGPVLDMLMDVRGSEEPKTYFEERLDAGERIMGFGHRVYSVRDPRAEVLSNAARQFYQADSGGDQAFFDLAQEVEDAAVEVLGERKPDLDLNTNVEFYTAVLLHGVGIPQALFTPTFAVSRVGGWTAHCREQLANNRLVHPNSKYTGNTGRTWVPINQRS